MATSVLVPESTEDVATFAERAESLGYHGVWASELWGRDAFVALTRAAERTDEIGLGTAVVNVYGRSPATLAQAGATLADVAGRRVRLGLGTSTQTAIEDLHGVAFENPPRRLHETVELTGQLLGADESVSYEGEFFEVTDVPPLGAELPVYAAALGPANRRATGRVADGWLPHNVPFPDLAAAFETVAETARAAGRDPEEIAVAPYVPAAVSEASEQARRAVREHIAYYVGSGEGYRRAVATRFPEAADAVAEAWAAGDRDAARGAVTDEMVAALAIAGAPEQARRQLRELAGRTVVDEPIVVVPAGADEDTTRETVTELSPERQ